MEEASRKVDEAEERQVNRKHLLGNTTAFDYLGVRLKSQVDNIKMQLRKNGSVISNYGR